MTGPTEKTDVDSTRVAAVACTERQLAAIWKQVPITRVSNVTPLDEIGLPVFVAVTPLARDLTTHAGRGATLAAARVSAMMEAVERISAEQMPEPSTVEGTFAWLSRSAELPAMNPIDFDLPADSDYRPDAKLRWCQSYDILRERSVLIAEDLAVNPARRCFLGGVDTNGLASGNTLLEATVHGLCEVIERDVLSQVEFVTQFGEPCDLEHVPRSIRLDTLPAAARFWIDRVLSCGLEVSIWNLPSDLAIPVFQTVLLDRAYPSAGLPFDARFPGFGAHPNATVAVLQSVTEAIQSRLGVIQGARESFNLFPGGSERSRFEDGLPSDAIAFDNIESAPSLDLALDLRFLLERLGRVGLDRVLITDLTRRDWGIPAVRVRVPGMASYVVNRGRVGWRCLRHLV